MFIIACPVFAQSNDQSSNDLVQAAISFAPRVGTFQSGSIFNVSIYLNTLEYSVSDVSLHIKFDPQKLAIVESLGNRSIITTWADQPNYSNKTGELLIHGLIKPALVTESGLIGTIIFKALALGEVKLFVDPDSKIIVDDDGIEKPVDVVFATGVYNIASIPSGDVNVFSLTHSLQNTWYKNDTPSFSWDKGASTEAFSFVFDDEPFTIPDNVSEGVSTSTTFPDTSEGIHYFHIKQQKNKIWGPTTHFLIKIDKTPPTNLVLKLNTMLAAVLTSRGIITFSAEDDLSGVDHYEVGVIDKDDPPDVSPIFIEVQSPYQLPETISGRVLVMVRAYDRAANVSTGIVGGTIFSSINDFVKYNYLVILLLLIIAIAIERYILGHKLVSVVIETFKLARNRVKEEDKTNIV